jgi:hypothetical protein
MSTARSRVRYSKLKEAEDSEGKNGTSSTSSKEVKSVRSQRPSKQGISGDVDYHDDQFEDTTVKVPVKSICVAIILFVVGTIFLTLGSLMLAGVIKQGGGSFRAAPLMIIGSMVFIPGAYNVRTAYCAWKGYHGYSFSDIAGFGEE